MAMKEMYMPRNFIVRSVSGHTAQFKKNKPTPVHPFAVEECIAAGAVFADGTLYTPENERKPEDVPMGFEREEKLYKGLQAIVERNDPDEFTANSLPTLKAVEKQVGFESDRREVDKVWRKILEARANEL